MFKKNIPLISIILIFLLGIWILLTFKIMDVPPSINGDEASIGYNASLVARTLKDENGKFLPLFFLTLDGKDWKQPVTLYSTAIAFKIFGPSFELLRKVSVIYVMISALLIFFLLKDILDIKGAFLGMMIFLTTPIIMIQSHLALENITPVPFVILWLLLLSKYQYLGLKKYLLWGGIVLGISFYSYNGMRLIVPILALITLIYVYNIDKNKEFKFNGLIYFLLGLIPFIIILPWVKNAYPGAIYGSARPVTILSYQQFLLPYISSFDFSFLFLKGDSTPYHSTGTQGMFLVFALPPFLIGSYKALKQKNPLFSLILAAFLLSPLLFGFVGSIYRASRMVVLVPFFAIISTLGFKYLWELRPKFLRASLGILLITAVLLNYLDFVNDYWFFYPQRVKENFNSISPVVFKNLYQQSIQNKSENVYLEKSIYQREGIKAKFFEQVYFPDSLKLWLPDESIPQKSVLFTPEVYLSTEKLIYLKKVSRLQDLGVIVAY